MTVDGIGSVRSKEHGRSTKFRGIEPAACGCLGTDKTVERMAAAVWLTLAERSRLRSGDVARPDTITLDVVSTIL